jgi:hypothetical protein
MKRGVVMLEKDNIRRMLARFESPSGDLNGMVSQELIRGLLDTADHLYDQVEASESIRHISSSAAQHVALHFRRRAEDAERVIHSFLHAHRLKPTVLPTDGRMVCICVSCRRARRYLGVGAKPRKDARQLKLFDKSRRRAARKEGKR